VTSPALVGALVFQGSNQCTVDRADRGGARTDDANKRDQLATIEKLLTLAVHPNTPPEEAASARIAAAKDFLKYIIQPKVNNERLKTGLGRNIPCMPSIVKTDHWWALC
jgi:hypothetical protein